MNAGTFLGAFPTRVPLSPRRIRARSLRVSLPLGVRLRVPARSPLSYRIRCPTMLAMCRGRQCAGVGRPFNRGPRMRSAGPWVGSPGRIHGMCSLGPGGADHGGRWPIGPAPVRLCGVGPGPGERSTEITTAALIVQSRPLRLKCAIVSARGRGALQCGPQGGPQMCNPVGRIPGVPCNTPPNEIRAPVGP